MPPDLDQKPAQVIRRPGGLEHLVFFRRKRCQAQLIFQMEDQLFDFLLIQSQLRQAGVVVEVILTFQQAADKAMTAARTAALFMAVLRGRYSCFP